jgi:hypothetical protein
VCDSYFERYATTSKLAKSRPPLLYSADMINVIKSTFSGTGREGDFEWMIEQPHHERTLFIFNDNESEFYAHYKGGQHRCSAGGGNAAIRAHQCKPEPQAIGIPTGTYDKGPHFKGYSSLDEQVTRAIGDSIAQIDALLATGRYHSLAFSWNDDTKLGGRLFNTAQVVRDYIVDQIFDVAGRH